MNWEEKQGTCPQGKVSHKWVPIRDVWKSELSPVEFRRSNCKACPVHTLCTRSVSGAREIGLRPKAQYLALQMARERQQTPEFKDRYRARAGIDGTIAQGVAVGGLRRSRYIGQAKTHLQHIAIAASLNVLRMVSWLMEIPMAKTRKFAFSLLCAQDAACLT